MNFINNYIIKV